jgi:HK97 family phage major capsid protein
MANVKEDDLKQVVELAGALEKAADEVKKSGETLQKEVKNLGDGTAETKIKVDDALLKHGELAKQHGELVKKHGDVVSRISEIEQTLAQRRQQSEGGQEKTLGQEFVESEAFKSFQGKGNVRVELKRKDIMNVTATVGTVTSPSNSLVSALRVPGIVTPPEQKLTVRDLVAPGQTNSGMVEYAQEVAFTNNAAVVTEGSTKPQSNVTFELKTAPVRTIANYFKASRQILDDAPALRSYIDARGRYGLRLAEESELLNGDGTGAHLKGLVPSATAFNAAFVATLKQSMDTLRLAILQVFQSNFPASGIVLNPLDWAAIQLTKDSTGRYIIGNPADGNTPRLWNLPVVESLSMTATEFLVGNFNMAAQIFDRMDVEVLLSTENDTDFIKNMITIRVEERLALAIYSPLALVHGDFDTAT